MDRLLKIATVPPHVSHNWSWAPAYKSPHCHYMNPILIMDRLLFEDCTGSFWMTYGIWVSNIILCWFLEWTNYLYITILSLHEFPLVDHAQLLINYGTVLIWIVVNWSWTDYLYITVLSLHEFLLVDHGQHSNYSYAAPSSLHEFLQDHHTTGTHSIGIDLRCCREWTCVAPATWLCLSLSHLRNLCRACKTFSVHWTFLTTD